MDYFRNTKVLRSVLSKEMGVCILSYMHVPESVTCKSEYIAENKNSLTFH